MPVRAPFVLLILAANAMNAGAQPVQASAVSESLVRAHMEFLAGDALKGRRSGTRDEWIAATYIAAQFRRLGLEPLGDEGGFVQRIEVIPSEPEDARKRESGRSRGAQAPSARNFTWNVIAALRGRDAANPGEAILLSAHLDHLGEIGDGATGGDRIYNGADDDASGTTAVLALAEALAHGVRPRRTILFALFGSEEVGGHGAKWFVDHPPVPLQSIVANLEFEMIGRPDAKVAPKTLWLTGWERTNLGPELAKHGAHLVGDPHSEQNFFMRSDNITLARRGVVAQTVSSFGLHGEYHQVSDDIAHIDFAHMTEAIDALIPSVRWLADSGFTPRWLPGGRP